MVFSGNLKGNGNFHLTLKKPLGKCPFPQNFQHKEHWEISPFFAELLCYQGHFSRTGTRKLSVFNFEFFAVFSRNFLFEVVLLSCSDGPWY